ncbi:ADP-dependent NAD(P)H-hydrate dehydratase [Gardnerella vaginalis]|uniref:ADP-dependent NAD(P)H-hydrate dehydratase n=1 Tax=Gardnerella vaginalis TaxID=2702 RepID=UPI00035451C5|nr:ADP/ATP-dependent (S)-NAD(P)H-hydrate dehydratase [Gardnerella vaginalis]EPI43294.1 putative YjeF domain protein [Gardnerella vaginalis JCP8481A]EPI44212.1 putative YjeF domain protein [Gardnerella vaginalis JCP8481B]
MIDDMPLLKYNSHNSNDASNASDFSTHQSFSTPQGFNNSHTCHDSNEVLVDTHLAATCLRTPRSEYNKYSRGVLGIVTGSQEYPGAAILSTRAAEYSNIGMVRYAGPLRAQNLVLQSAPETVVCERLEGTVQAITVGSGIPDATHCNTDETKAQRDYISEILAKYATNTESANALPPICVDAGALDLLPKKVCTKVVVTPHTGELCSVFQQYGLAINAQQIASNPVHYAQEAANLTGATVLLKGAKTVVASPSNLHMPIYVAQYGPTWLATAGSGDVLAGILGALLAQQTAHCTNYALVAASAAVIHGIAAILASYSCSDNNCTQIMQSMVKTEKPLMFEHPIVASDVITALPHVFGMLINLK